MNRLFMKLGFIIILSSVQCLIIGTKNQQPNLFENPVSRNLKDSNSNQKTPQVIQVKTNQTKAERKLQFLKIVQNILKKAEERQLSIKSIKLGSKLKRIFKNENIKNELQKIVNDKNLDLSVIKLTQKVKDEKQKIAKDRSRRLRGELISASEQTKKTN